MSVRSGLMPVDDAITLLRQAGESRLPDVEEVDLGDALNRVLAEAVVATVDVPPEPNSAMDGYALYSGDQRDGAAFAVTQRIPAGLSPGPLQPGTLARIFTGAVVPAGADAVVMQENCELLPDGTVRLLQAVEAGENVRPQGQDIGRGQTVLRQGERLTPAALGLLATLGRARVRVYRRLRVAVLSSGDELVEPGLPLAPGQIYNSNRTLVRALLTQLGFEAVDTGVVADNLAATVAALAAAAARADIIISTGGVSVGEEDHLKAAVSQCGALDLWKVAIKPGKPLAFGRVGDVPFLGLPGNPQSVWVTFLILARQFLLARQGQRYRLDPQMFPVAAGFAVTRTQQRREYLRVRLVAGANGFMLQKHDNQSSGVLSSAVWADGFALIDVEKTAQIGDFLAFLPFSSLGVA